MAQSLLRLPQVIERSGYKRSSIYAMVRRGEFPEPIPLGPRIVVWDSEQIDEWVRQQIELGRARGSHQRRNQPMPAAA